MPEFPSLGVSPHQNGLGTLGSASQLSEISVGTNQVANTSAVWPAANRAIYCPVLVDFHCVVTKIAFRVATQSGNCDVGIYDENGNRLVSKGSTAVGAAGLQVIDITDTTLLRGFYYLAMNVDNTTASFGRAALNTELLRACGLQQQAVGSVTLPNPATFANPASSYLPAITASLASVL